MKIFLFILGFFLLLMPLFLFYSGAFLCSGWDCLGRDGFIVLSLIISFILSIFFFFLSWFLPGEDERLKQQTDKLVQKLREIDTK